MANVIELKDGSGTKAYPITKAEAVYYDEDYYVDEKIHALEVEAKTSGSLMPIYIGDYIISNNYLPSATVKIGNYFYVFNAPSNAYATANNTDIGKLRVFDVSTNQEVKSMAMDLKMGHANSVCYNPTENAIYLTPLCIYENNQAVQISKIYKYDLSFSTVTEIDVGSGNPGSITYDFVTGEMYYRYREHKYKNKIYKYVNGSWEFYTSIDFTDMPPYIISSIDRDYNQDMAVRDNIFYMSAPHGNIIYGELKEGTSTPSGQYILSNVDVGNYYRIGELEGFEFDEDGHLYASQYSTLTGACFSGFVTEIPVGKSYPTSTSGSTWGGHTGTATYIGTDNPVFANNFLYARSINQLRILMIKHTQLRVEEGTVIKEEFPVIIDQSVAIELYGELQTMPIDVQCGVLTINGAGENHKIKFLDTETAPITLEQRSTEVRFVGAYAVNVDLNGSTRTTANLVNPRTGYGRVMTRFRPVRVDTTGLLNIASVPIIAFSDYIGTKNLAYVNEDSISINNPCCFAGFITNGSTEVRFYIPWHKDIYTGGVTTGKITAGSVIIRGPEGYIANPLDLTNSTYTITTLASTTGFNITIKFPSAITPPSGSVFSSYNNIPVSVAISTNISITLTYA